MAPNTLQASFGDLWWKLVYIIDNSGSFFMIYAPFIHFMVDFIRYPFGIICDVFVEHPLSVGYQCNEYVNIYVTNKTSLQCIFTPSLPLYLGLSSPNIV